MLHFYDFECFRYDWMVVIISPFNREKTVIVNDYEKLKAYYKKYKNEIFIGFNSNNYDQYLFKGALLDMNLYDISDAIINQDKKGWQLSGLFRKIQFYNYDIMTNYHGLKTLEGFMGNNIKETGVPFDIPRKLTQAEIDETIKYCTHDVEQTMEVFLERKNEFNAQMSLIKEFKLPLAYISKTQAQLAAIILGAKRVDYNDEWDIRLPETLKLNKYRCVANWFMNEANYDYAKSLKLDIAGIPHIVAWGGLHGAINKFSYTCKSDELMIMADVAQLYPTLMVVYHLLSRGVTKPELFKHILATSLRLKAEHKKKEREPYKRICNITYGAEGDKNNAMYDPLHRTLVCIFGQLLVIDLIEKLETIPSFKLFQSNTDGILVLIKRKDFEAFDDIVYEWEQRTGLTMEFDYFKSIYQKDVNNYIAVGYDGEMKPKGSYVKSLNRLDNDLPIINKAMSEYMTKGVSIEATINGCDDLIMFQKIVKISRKYLYGLHNNIKLTDKTFRVFASNNFNDDGIYKVKSLDKNPEKFANTPEHCFIWNDSVNNIKVPGWLDKSWYIDLTKKRLVQFGIEI